MVRPADHDAQRDLELDALLEEVRLIEAQSSRLVTGVMAGGYSSVFRGPGIEMDQVREYVEGDDPRSIDWNVTARAGRPFVKEYVEERERTLLFALDLSASMSGGCAAWSARQMAARTCACLALSAIANDDRVGLITFGADVLDFVPPRKGLRHVLRIVRDSLALPATASRTTLVPALEFAARVVRRRAVMFVVSDFLVEDGWGEALQLCARRHDVVAMRLLAPELSPPRAGMVRLRDPETGRLVVVDWRSRRAREAYAQRVARWRDATEATLRQARVDRVDVPVPVEPTWDAVARPILAFFRKRARQGERR